MVVFVLLWATICTIWTMVATLVIMLMPDPPPAGGVLPPPAPGSLPELPPLAPGSAFCVAPELLT